MTIRKILLSLFLATSATAWLSPHPALAWSSIDQKGFFGALATHQYLNEKAYSVLKKHPAFKESGFPFLAEIQYYSGVNAKVEGPGPDGEGNTRYALHYYNPVTRKGKAPETVDRYQGYLLRNLVDGEKTVTLRGENIAQEFIALIDEYVERRYVAIID